jgi:PAS domain S-box-containing protein
VSRQLKQDERTKDIPIIFVSGLQDIEDRIQGFEAGGVDFISKPFQEAEILVRVKTHLQLYRIQIQLEDLVAERTADLTATNAELVKSEAKYRGLVDTSLVGVFHSKPNGQFIFVNQALARMLDFDSPEQMAIEGTLPLWADPNRRERFLTKLREQGYVNNFETEAITHAGRPIHVLFSATLNGENISGMVMDITDRKQAEQKLIDYQQRLKALAFQLTIAEEKERYRIAQILHDHIGQSLALARAQIASASDSASEPALADKLEDISHSLFEILEDTDQLMFELSSPLLDEISFSASISEWLEEQLGNKHGLKTEFIDNIIEDRGTIQDQNVQAILFRNVKELLVNVVKHARASKVSVRLENENSSMKVFVEDDGIGFDPRNVNREGSQIGGFGLFSIEERMADLGGSFKIVSEPGKGSTAILCVPLDLDNNQERN